MLQLDKIPLEPLVNERMPRSHDNHLMCDRWKKKDLTWMYSPVGMKNTCGSEINPDLWGDNIVVEMTR